MTAGALRATGGQAFWAGPFVCLSLLALSLLRPWPQFPAPAHTRLVTDARGAPVAIPASPRGVVAWAEDFLQKTHVPQLLLKGGGPRERGFFSGTLVSRMYPQVLNDAERWNMSGDLETQLARDPGGTVYLDGTDRSRLGLVNVATWPGPRSIDETIFTMTRVMNAVIGQEARGEALIADYQRHLADLDDELRPESLTNLPRTAGVVCPPGNWSRLSAEGSDQPRAGVRGVGRGYLATGREQDAERILAMNPDIIVLYVGITHEFLRDPRWQGLKAVQTRRVYQNVVEFHGYTFDLDGVPLGTRWLAELAHPDRLAPRMRKLLRSHFAQGYGCEFSEAELDALLRVEANAESAGYARFSRDPTAGLAARSP